MFRAILTLSMLPFIAACGGGGGGNTIEDPDFDNPNSTFLQRVSDYGPRAGEIAGTDAVALDDLVAAGSATYEGEALFYDTVLPVNGDASGIPEQPTLAGLLSVTTTFGGAGEGSYTAVVSDFVDENDVEKTGQLVVSDGSLTGFDLSDFDGEDFTTGSGIISGTISGPGAGNGTYNAQSTILVREGGVIGGGGNGVADDFEDEGDDFTVLFAAD